MLNVPSSERVQHLSNKKKKLFRKAPASNNVWLGSFKNAPKSCQIELLSGAPRSVGATCGCYITTFVRRPKKRFWKSVGYDFRWAPIRFQSRRVPGGWTGTYPAGVLTDLCITAATHAGASHTHGTSRRLQLWNESPVRPHAHLTSRKGGLCEIPNRVASEASFTTVSTPAVPAASLPFGERSHLRGPATTNFACADPTGTPDRSGLGRVPCLRRLAAWTGRHVLTGKMESPSATTSRRLAPAVSREVDVSHDHLWWTLRHRLHGTPCSASQSKTSVSNTRKRCPAVTAPPAEWEEREDCEGEGCRRAKDRSGKEDKPHEMRKETPAGCHSQRGRGLPLQERGEGTRKV